MRTADFDKFVVGRISVGLSLVNGEAVVVESLVSDDEKVPLGCASMSLYECGTCGAFIRGRDWMDHRIEHPILTLV